MKNKLLATVFTVISLSIFAQENEPDTLPTIYNDITEVVLTANKKNESGEDIPQSIQIIRRKSIQQLMPQTVADALIQNGNVFVQKSQMGGGSPVIRGFEANSVLLVVDGVRMNNAIYRGGHLQNVISVDPNALERMEVFAGPGSILYGSDALGGVIHMYTIRPNFSLGDSFTTHANAFARYSTANNENTLHTDVHYSNNKWAMVSSFTFAGYGDVRMGSNNSIYRDSAFGNKSFVATRINNKDTMQTNSNALRQVSTGYSQVDLLQKVMYYQNEKTNHLVNIQYSKSSDIPRYDRLSELSKGLPAYAEWYYGPQQRFLAAYSLIKKGYKWFDNSNSTLSYQNVKESRFQRRFAKNDLKSSQETVHVVGLNLDFDKELKDRHELRYGAEVTFNLVQSIGQSEDISNGIKQTIVSRYPDGSNTFNAAAYLSYRWEMSKKIILSAGSRINHYQLNATFNPAFYNFGNNIIKQSNTVANGHLGLVYKPTKRFRLIGQISTGYRNPNIDDVGKTFERTDNSIVLPNPNLKPEQVFTQEVGVDYYITKKTWFDVRAYNTNFTNAIAPRVVPFQGMDSILVDGKNLLALSNVNINKATIQGVSASLNARLARFFSLKANIEYTYGQDITNNVALSHIPPIFASLYLGYDKPKYSALFYVLYNGKKDISRYAPAGEDNQNYAPSYGTPAWYTLNIKGRYNFNDRLRIQGAIENIMDLNYRYFASGISAAGINGIVSVNYSF